MAHEALVFQFRLFGFWLCLLGLLWCAVHRGCAKRGIHRVLEPPLSLVLSVVSFIFWIGHGQTSEAASVYANL